MKNQVLDRVPIESRERERKPANAGLDGNNISRAASEEQTSLSVSELFITAIEEYSGMAYSVAIRMLRSPEDAEDAVQEAFLSGYRHFSSFKGNSKLSTWLYRIVVNTCLMKLRKKKTEAKYLEGIEYEYSRVKNWATDPQQFAENDHLRDSILEGLNRLPPHVRAAVVLRDVEEFSSEEASEVLDISVSALKSRLHRGRLLLRKHLEDVWHER